MKRDWIAIKAAYIAGARTSDIANKFGIKLGTLKSRASREGWPACRRDVALRVESELPAAIAGALAEQAADGAILNRTEGLVIVATIARDANNGPKDRLAAVKLAADIEQWGVIAVAGPDGQVGGVLELPPLDPPPIHPDDLAQVDVQGVG